jgi:hypothetical protein
MYRDVSGKTQPGLHAKQALKFLFVNEIFNGSKTFH